MLERIDAFKFKQWIEHNISCFNRYLEKDPENKEALACVKCLEQVMSKIDEFTIPLIMAESILSCKPYTPIILNEELKVKNDTE